MKNRLSIILLIFAMLTTPVWASDNSAAVQNFQQADVNGDKALNQKEFRTFIDLNAEDNIGRANMVKSRKLYSMAFGRLDKNKDGKLTANELGQR
ncbi:hypothetical protein [Thiofilum flexile]|uniref:hypothetical protein n=1 Tax=Thiofilum flexile TaxID=125627 RepID=UPI000369F35B|nr:hypothetical protein [Thiofilum flexile]